MVLLSLTSSLNKVVAPFMLRHGLTLRLALGRGVIRDDPLLDSMLLLPLSQKLLSLEIHQAGVAKDESKQSKLDKIAEKSFDRIFGPDEPVKNAKVAALEKCLRPVLVPNERWSDVHRWMFHSRFVKFARAEYLRAEHDLKSVMDKYPKLRQSPQVAFAKSLEALLGSAALDSREKVQSTTLPSAKSVRSACDMKTWNQNKDTAAIWNRMSKLTEDLGGQVLSIPGTSLRIPMLDDKADMSTLSVGDILELAGGHVASCGPFNVLCEECDIYQLWSKEYIDTLAKYLLDRSSNSTIILDIGAGDGLLAQLLREHFADEDNGPQIIAIDDGSWKIRSKCPVEKLSAKQAFEKYAPREDENASIIVICSWMPMGQDWTALFREHRVDEYILIGEYFDGNCGDNWETWGNPEFADSAKSTLPYQGYKMVELTHLAPFSFSRFDSEDSANSATVSFQKI